MTSLLCRRTEELAEAADLVKWGIAAGDEALVRRSAQVLRSVRKRVHELQAVSGDIDMEELLRMRLASERVREGEQAYVEWMRRALGPDSEVLKEEGGLERLCDVILPLDWDLERDMIVLMGARAEDVAAELYRRGQRRVVVYGERRAPTIIEEVPWARSRSEVRNAVMNFPGRMARYVLVRDLDQVKGAGDEKLEEWHELLEGAMQAARMRRNTFDRFGEVWIKQGLSNMPALARLPSVCALRAAFPRKPMVVVAPGPSLAKNVHLLRKLEKRAVVVTFTHAVHALHRFGIVPDLVLALDPEDLRYHFEGIDTTRFSLVLSATIHPDVYKLPCKRIFTFAGNSSLDDWIFECLGEAPTLQSGGCVAHSALALGFLTGADPIVFVGQDLAFEGDRYYVEECVDGGSRLQLAADGKTFTTKGYSAGFANLDTVSGPETKAEDLVQVPGWHGGMVSTSSTFRQYLRWFALAADNAKGRVKLMNCTEGGAWIPGMEHVRLEEALAGMSGEVDVEAILAERWKERPEGSERMDRRLVEIREAIAESLNAAAECVRLCRMRELEKLEEAEKTLAVALQPVLFAGIMDQVGMRKAESLARCAQNGEDMLNACTGMYETIADTLKRIPV